MKEAETNLRFLFAQGQTQEDRRQALEKIGISVESSGIKVEKNKCFLVNLNSDPSLNELLVSVVIRL